MKKRNPLISLIVCFLLLAAVTGVSTVTRVFDAIGWFSSLNLHFGTVAKLFVMAFLVLTIEKILIFVLSLVNFQRSRVKTLSTILSSLLHYASGLIILCWGLSILGVDVGTIVASVGILALILGFGAQRLVEDVVTGFFMIFENQYNVGDIVEVSGFRGQVTQIGIRTTSLVDNGGNVRIINNANMTDIVNRSNQASKAICDFGIPYEADLEAVEAKLHDVLFEIYTENPREFHAIPQYLGVQSLDDSAVILRFAADVDDSKIFTSTRILNRALFLKLRAIGVEAPYPQLDVHNR